MADRRQAAQAELAASAPVASPSERPVPATSISTSDTGTEVASQIPADVRQQILAATKNPDGTSTIVYRPALLGSGRLHFVRVAYKVDSWQDRHFLVPCATDPKGHAWETARGVQEDQLVWHSEARPGAQFADLPPALTVAKNYKTWQRQLVDHLYQSQTLTVWRCAALKQYSQPGEAEDAFRIRLSQLAHEQRDEQVEELRRKYASKLATLNDQIQRATQRVAKEKDEYHQTTLDTVISVGSSIFGALLGRKLMSRTNVSKASTSAQCRPSGGARSDIGRAEERLGTLKQKMKQLQEQIEQDVQKIDTVYQPGQLEFEALEVRPRKSDIEVQPITVVWTPWLVDAAGIAEPAY